MLCLLFAYTGCLHPPGPREWPLSWLCLCDHVRCCCCPGGHCAAERPGVQREPFIHTFTALPNCTHPPCAPAFSPTGVLLVCWSCLCHDCADLWGSRLEHLLCVTVPSVSFGLLMRVFPTGSHHPRERSPAPRLWWWWIQGWWSRRRIWR